MEKASEILHNVDLTAASIGWKSMNRTFPALCAATWILELEERITELEDALKQAGVPVPRPEEAILKKWGVAPYQPDCSK